MQSECKHSEEWHLVINREPGVDDADWAEILPVQGTRTRFFKPDKITLRLRKHDTLPVTVAIHGERDLGGATPRPRQETRVTSRYTLDRNLPEFAQILVERARQIHHCGEGTVQPYG